MGLRSLRKHLGNFGKELKDVEGLLVEKNIHPLVIFHVLKRLNKDIKGGKKFTSFKDLFDDVFSEAKELEVSKFKDLVMEYVPAIKRAFK